MSENAGYVAAAPRRETSPAHWAGACHGAAWAAPSGQDNACESDGGLNLLEIGNRRRDRQSLWLRGGFPDSYLAATDDVAMDWIEDLIRTYLERDVPQMGFRVSSARLRRLWTMLAHLQGESVNYSKLAANLEMDAKSVSHYMDILSGLLLLRRVEPWHKNVKKRLVKSARCYVRDSGILHRLLVMTAMIDCCPIRFSARAGRGLLLRTFIRCCRVGPRPTSIEPRRGRRLIWSSSCPRPRSERSRSSTAPRPSWASITVGYVMMLARPASMSSTAVTMNFQLAAMCKSSRLAASWIGFSKVPHGVNESTG